MAEYTTLQEMMAKGTPAAPSNPFENLTQGYQQGVQQGNSLMGRVLEVQKMRQEAGFRQQEITNQTNQMRTNSLVKIADAYADGDNGMGKLLADNHKDMASKYGWSDNPWVDVMSKSADARQAILSGVDKTQLSDPQYVASLTAQLDAAGGNPLKMNEILKGLSAAPQQRANTQIMFQNKKFLEENKHTLDMAEKSAKYGNPEEQTMLTDPSKFGSPEYYQAVASVASKAASANKQKEGLANEKTASETQKNRAVGAAATANSGLRQQQDQDKVFNPIEQHLDKDLSSVRRLHHADQLLQPGANWAEFQLAIDDMIYGVKNSSRITQQEQSSIGFNDMSKLLQQATQYVTEKREGGPSPALIQQYQSTKNRLMKDIEGPAAEDFVKYANGRVQTGRTDDYTAKARFESLFPGKTWEDTKAKLGLGPSTQAAPPSPNQQSSASRLKIPQSQISGINKFPVPAGQQSQQATPSIQDKINQVIRGGNPAMIDALKKKYPNYNFSGGGNGP